MIIAHLDSRDEVRREPLSDHLALVEKYAREFGSEFNAPELASLLARVHDFGKCSREFQMYISSHEGDTEEEREEDAWRKGPDHSTAGAQWLWNHPKLPGIGHLLAYAVAGHHAGLPDGISQFQSSLANRIKKVNLPRWEESALSNLPPSCFETDRVKLASELKPFIQDGEGYSEFFLVRMLFSCLVDADFLATEEFMDGETAASRHVGRQTTEELERRLNQYYVSLAERTPSTPVNQIRNEVKTDCLAIAEMDPGLFTLTVPTGGGKTLASMAFALKHAVMHGLKRIIYVIPYTSIIEQNAKVFRSVFGDDSILEHHCNFDFDAGDSRMKLLSENWDAPIVVTTSVQFFESLHANRTSRCRKLHNLANAVIIFDEAQSLPVDLLKPCLRAMDELVMHYRSSVVLCTATQPAVLASQLKQGGLRSVQREIVGANRNLHARLKRVHIQRIEGQITDDQLIDHVKRFMSALVIVSTRGHARRLYEELCLRGGQDEVFHLSAQMCPEHRTEVLSEVKERLSRHESCYLVSTQLIEAGVDIDFPCVFRELAGVDSMAQAAGRCNREGRMDDLGQVFLFESKDCAPPPGFLRVAAQEGRETIGLPDFQSDLISPESVKKYFELLYASQANSLDKFNVLKELIPAKFCGSPDAILGCQFKTLGEKFRFIDNDSASVFIPYGEEGIMLCEELRKAYSPTEQRAIARKLQRYAVSLYERQLLDEHGGPMTELVHGVYRILTNTDMYYNPHFGVTTKIKDLLLAL